MNNTNDKQGGIMNLIQSNVIFNHEEHTYNLNGLYLSGITNIINKYICPDKYTDIPERILEIAKEKGTRIHEQIELLISGFTMDEYDDEIASFERWRTEGGKARNLLSEYLVSDNTAFATMIDIVECIDDTYNIYDIKTTSTLDKEYVRWQLSICAYLMELQNPGIKIGKLSAIHLRGKDIQVVEVERINTEVIKGLLDAAVQDAEWANPFITTDLEARTIDEVLMLDSAIKSLDEQLKYYKEKKEQLNESLLAYMKDNGIAKIDTPSISVTIKDAYTRASIDSTRLKKEQPEIYSQFLKETQVKESLTIKIK
jgi:hypothetical protein